jgi:hypothetical protein
MPLTTILVTLFIFLLGIAIGWRFNVAGASVFLVLIPSFVAIDYRAVSITLWRVPHWGIVDLIARQVGYLCGAVLEFVVGGRRARNRRGSC